MLMRLISCILLFGGTLTLFLEHNNRLTKLRMELPHLQQEMGVREEAVKGLRYEIDCHEDPRELLKIAERPEFAHLHYPTQDQVVEIF